MKPRITVIVVAALCLQAGTVTAQEDVMGLSFSLAEWDVCRDVAPMEPFDVHVLGYLPGVPEGISGFWFRVDWPENLLNVGVSPPPRGMQIDTFDWNIGWINIVPPLVADPQTGFTRLLSYTFLALDAEPIHLLLGGAFQEELPAVADVDEVYEYIALRHGDGDQPAAAVNDPDCAVVATTPTTFGAVKSLFK